MDHLPARSRKGCAVRLAANDYVVWRNYSADHKYYINDGEGLMHENHCNSHVKDSRLIGNRGYEVVEGSRQSKLKRR